MIFNAYADKNEGMFGISIKSCGHIFAKKGREIKRPYGRDDWLLFYVARDCETFYLDKKTCLEAGSFIIFKPHEKQHHIYEGDKTGEFYYIHFTADENFDLSGLETSTAYNTKPSAKICDIFESVINEIQLKQPCYENICVLKLLEIFQLLKRKLINKSSPHSEYINKIAFVVQKINKDYNSSCSLNEYAKMCQMSKFHFLRIFQEITGTSPIEYRIKIRMEHAKELLLDTSLPINEIGLKVGYNSSSYFCDAFKKEVGISPIKYRSKYRLK